jgi:FkbM family methyltransferase
MGFNFERIIAVEMHPRTFRRLRFNIEANFDCELSLINAAVAGRDGSITLRVGPGGTGDSILKVSGGTQISVPAITLDRLIDRSSIDLVKLDIEGAEFEVFNSETYRSIRLCRYLIAEIHPEYGNPLVVLEKLRDSGFERVEVASGQDGIFCLVNKNWTM